METKEEEAFNAENADNNYNYENPNAYPDLDPNPYNISSRKNNSVLTSTFINRNKIENIKIIKKKIKLRQKELKIKMSIKEIFKYVKQKCKNMKICCCYKNKEEKNEDVKIKLFQIAQERILEFCDISKLIKSASFSTYLVSIFFSN